MDCVDAYYESVCVSELSDVENVGGKGNVTYVLTAMLSAKRGDGEMKEGREAFYCY